MVEAFLWNLFIHIIQSIPRLVRRIKRYFQFAYMVYLREKQRQERKNPVIMIGMDGKRERLREMLNKIATNKWPIFIFIAMFLLIPFATICVLYMTIKIALPYAVLGIILIIGYLSWLEGKNTHIPLYGVYGTLTNWAYMVIVGLCRAQALPSAIRIPTGVSEVFGSPSIVFIEGVGRLQFYIPLQVDKQNVEFDLADVKELLQGGINNMLTEGKLPDQPYIIDPHIHMPRPIVSIDGEPIITIADITREKLRLVVTAFWVDNVNMANTVKHWRGRSQKNEGGARTDDTDRDY